MEHVPKPIYLDQILEMTGWSKSKFMRLANELHKAGVIFYDYEGYGQKKRKRIKAFPHRIEKWLHLKSIENFPEK